MQGNVYEIQILARERQQLLLEEAQRRLPGTSDSVRDQIGNLFIQVGERIRSTDQEQWREGQPWMLNRFAKHYF